MKTAILKSVLTGIIGYIIGLIVSLFTSDFTLSDVFYCSVGSATGIFIYSFIWEDVNKKPDGFKNATYRGIPCWFDERVNEIKGKTVLFDVLIDLNIWVDFNLLGVDELPIKILE